MSFLEKAIGEIVTFQRGFDITHAERVDGDVPIISSSGITAYHNKSKVSGQGVIIGRKGTLGTVHYIDRDYWPHDTTLWVKEFHGNDPKFVYYFLQLMHFENFDVGSANPTLNRNHIHKIKVKFPDLTTQRKIAAILSVYDDLIENNKRRIALLEKMAEEIYREWFVRFRFPAWQEAEFEKGIPKGWLSLPSDQVLDVLGGGTPKTDVHDYWDGDIPFFTPKDATDRFYVLNTEKNITPKGLDKCNSKLYEKNIIFITARGTVGKIAIAQTEMAMNQSCYALRPKDKKSYFFYFLSMSNAIAQVKGVAKSGVFDNIIVDTFKIINLLIPNGTLIADFEKLVSPIFEQISKLSLSNINMERTKSALLPRLISGKLSVEELEVRFPPSMLDDG